MKQIPPHIPPDGTEYGVAPRPGTIYFVVMILIGAASGFVASIFYAAYGPTPTTKFETRIEQVTQGIDEHRIMNAQESMATVLGAPEGALYATAITSDGWFIADQRAARSKRILVRGQGTFAIEKTVIDTATGLAFLKTQAQNMRVLDDEPLRDVPRGTQILAVLPTTALPLTLQDSALCITDKCPLEYADQLSYAGVVVEPLAPHVADGAPVITVRGSLLGFATTQNNRLVIIPTSVMKPLFQSVFTMGTITRVSLGLRVQNTMRVPLPDTNGVRQGMRVEVLHIAHPPHALRDGDILTHIAGQPIEADTTLFLLLQNKVGEKTVPMTLIRDGKIVQIQTPLSTKISHTP